MKANFAFRGVSSCSSMGIVSSALLLMSCSSDDTPKAWNALATCLAGKAAGSPIGERVQAMRRIQIGNGSNTAGKDAWPKRCASYADTLYATLPTSGDNAVLRSQMGQKLRCSETAGSCTLPDDGTLISVSTLIWDAAKAGGLNTEVAPDVRSPPSAPAPLFDNKSWKPLSAKPVKLSGPVLTPDGRGLLILKPEEGRARPNACEFTDDFSKVHCFEGNAAMPELPVQSIEAVSDPKGVFAAGLTDDGLFAYDLQTGTKSDVRGRSGHQTRDGLVVEKGVKNEISQEPPPGLPGMGPKGKGKAKKPKKAAPAANKPDPAEGYVAVELNAGKASKEIKLPYKDIVGDPIAMGNQFAYLSASDGDGELVVKSLTHGRLKDVTRIRGKFSGALHSCQQGQNVAFASFSGRASQHSAKPTGGEGKTQLTFTLFQNGAWSKAAEATLPFDRAFESELVCNDKGASLTWARSLEGSAEVGRLDCNADGCKTSEVKLPGVQSKWWWGVAPVGDKVFLLWRGLLGEARFRFASLADLANSNDVLAFDSPDFGGPAAGELSLLSSPDAALLIFRNEQPVALRVGSDGTPHLLSP